MRNRHPGTCYVCFSQVKAGEGFFNRKPDGSGWRVHHAECTRARAKDGPTTVLQVDAGQFNAGLLMRDRRVVEAPPILKYMAGWSQDRVESYCSKKSWEVKEIGQ